MIFVFLFLTYFTLYASLEVNPHLYKWPSIVPFYGRIIFHCPSFLELSSHTLMPLCPKTLLKSSGAYLPFSGSSKGICSFLLTYSISMVSQYSRPVGCLVKLDDQCSHRLSYGTRLQDWLYSVFAKHQRYFYWMQADASDVLCCRM